MKYIIKIAIISVFLSLAVVAFANGPVGVYHFEECSGINTADSSIYGNNGTINGSGYSWTGGYVNHGLYLNNTKIILQNNQQSLSPAKDVTVQAWIRPFVSQGAHGIAGNWYEPAGLFAPKGYLLFQSGDKIVFYIGAGHMKLLAAYSTVNFTQWHHVAGTYNGTTAKLYIDGSLADQKSWSSENIKYGPSTPKIGAYVWDGIEQAYFEGLIDEVSINDIVLNSSTIYASTPYNGTFC